MKKINILKIFTIVLVLIGLSFIVYKNIVPNKFIGTISGPEFEYIIINNKTYQINYENEFTCADKGRFLGYVRNGDIIFRVYSVKGDDENKYIYRLWGYEGAYYKVVE